MPAKSTKSETGTDQVTDQVTDQPAKAKATKLTRAQVVAQHAAQGGKCWVSGAPLGDDFVVVGDKLITKAVNKRRGGESLEGLRVKLLVDLHDALELQQSYGHLLSGDPDSGVTIVFAGEWIKGITKT